MKSSLNLKCLMAVAVMAFAVSAQASNNKGDTIYNQGENTYIQPASHATGGTGGQGGDATGGTGVGVGIAGAAAGAVAGSESNSVAGALSGSASSVGNTTAAGGKSDASATGGKSDSNAIAAGGAGGKVDSNILATNKAGDVTGKTGDITLDLSNRGTSTFRAVDWSPINHGPGAAPLATATMMVTHLKCGPRFDIVRSALIGKRFGVIFTTDVEQGFTDEIVDSAEPFINIGGYLMGHEGTVHTAVLGMASSASLSLGVFNKDGEAAQGGAAGSGGLQQFGKTVVKRNCIFAEAKPAK